MTRVAAVLTLVCLAAPAGAQSTDSQAARPPLTSLAFAPDGRSVVATSQAGLHVYDWPALTARPVIAAAARNLQSLAFSPGGDVLAVAGGHPAQRGIVELFSWPDGASVGTVSEQRDSVMAVVWLDQTSVLSASLDRSILLWDLASGTAIRTLGAHSRGVAALGLLDDGRTLVSGGVDLSLRVWNLETGAVVRSLDQHTGAIHSIAVRPGGDGLPMVASAAEDRSIRFWQPTIGRMVRFARLESVPLDIAWWPDGSRVVAACADGRVRFIDPVSVEVTEDLPALDGWAYALAVHPTDGSVVVGGAGGQIRRVVPAPER